MDSGAGLEWRERSDSKESGSVTGGGGCTGI